LTLDADDLITLLDLQPHPEGGHYRETIRDAAGPGLRAHSTAIYFLLKASERSRWHRIDATEIWHWYAGAPLALSILQDGAERRAILGNDFEAGQRPQCVVPASVWQAAKTLGAFTLVGCTVAPGFLFEQFELAGDELESMLRRD
jgi:predicted cupin superfamily sugar epimerase